jgi:curved DNA-binding protein CbpA
MAKNYYEILGVPENASDADIEAAFKVKAREVHPDTVPADNPYLRQVASEAFKDLSEAKATLLDRTAREKFDGSLAAERERARESSSSSSSSDSADSSSTHRTRTGSRLGSSRRTGSVPLRARDPKPEQFSVHGSRHGHDLFLSSVGSQRTHAAALARRRHRCNRNFSLR